MAAANCAASQQRLPPAGCAPPLPTAAAQCNDQCMCRGTAYTYSYCCLIFHHHANCNHDTLFQPVNVAPRNEFPQELPTGYLAAACSPLLVQLFCPWYLPPPSFRIDILRCFRILVHHTRVPSIAWHPPPPLLVAVLAREQACNSMYSSRPPGGTGFAASAATLLLVLAAAFQPCTAELENFCSVDISMISVHDLDFTSLEQADDASDAMLKVADGWLSVSAALGAGPRLSSTAPPRRGGELAAAHPPARRAKLS